MSRESLTNFLSVLNSYNIFLTDTICLTLSDAINKGNEVFACDLVRHLASQKVALRIRLDDLENEKSTRDVKDNKIKFVVDLLSSILSLRLKSFEKSLIMSSLFVPASVTSRNVIFKSTSSKV